MNGALLWTVKRQGVGRNLGHMPGKAGTEKKERCPSTANQTPAEPELQEARGARLSGVIKT